MSAPSFKILKYLFVISLLFCFKPASAQVKYEDISFRIDSFANAGLPKSALKEVDLLDALARKNNNAPQQIRAIIYRMTFQSYLEEDALVAIISRLKLDIDRADYPVKPVLQSLLAQMYWNYYQQNRYQFSQRSKLEKPDADFTKWDLQTIINETSRLYDLSLHDAEKEQNTPVGILDGVLDGDKSTRYLRPTLYDLLVQRAFDFFLADEAGINKPKLPFTLNDPRFFSDSRAFAGLEIKTTDTASTEYKGIKYLQQATLFHLQKPDDEALADIDLQRLRFLYAKVTVEHKDSLYLAALKQIASHFSAKPISAEALVLQGQYYQGIDSLTIAHDLFKKAVAAYPESLGGKNAATLIKQIEEKELSATVEDVNVPGKPLLAFLNYTNVKEASISIYHLSQLQVKQLTDKDAWYEGITITPNDKVVKLLKQLQPVQDQQLSLPDPKDFRKHSVEFEINPLSAGTYIIVVKDAQSKNKNSLQLTSFIVTGLSYSARVAPSGETELRIMDRQTGRPLKGVNVSVYKWNYNDSKAIKNNLYSGVSDSDGKFVFKSINYDECTIALSYNNDYYTEGEKRFYGAVEPKPNNTPQINTVLFTDRQIYRPGQTIYFKGLQISILNGKSSIVPQTSLTVNFYDMNYKLINSQKMQTNEFGSVQGSFIIPQTIINGSVFLNTAYGSINMRVEEYKRPTFQVEFPPVTATYRLNDSVKIKGKVTAFSGYGLSQAKVAYHITRQVKPRFYNNYRQNIRSFRGGFDEIKTDTIKTNDQGEFEINFKATPGEQNSLSDTYSYAVNTEVTDASSETQSGNITVSISNNPLELTAEIPDKLLEKDTAVIPLKLTNVNGQAQKGMVKVSIYKLKGPGQVFKTRLWDAPDQFILKKDAFKKTFPAYSWQNEDDYNKWPTSEKLNDIAINVSDTTENNLDLGILKKQATGIYKVTIKANNARGDTTSLTQFVNVIAEPAKAQKMDDWVIPVITKVKAGEQAEFLVGINKPASVLMEKFNGPKLVSSQWLSLSGEYQQKIKVSVPAGSKNNMSVQFLMVSDNRIYHYYQRIEVQDTVKKLNIHFLTLRNKLQPGEKEQWKVQITAANNEKLPAEMLADLYDASLDDITPAQYWKTDFDYAPYNPNYFEWANDEFAKPDETSPYKQYYDDYRLTEIQYEHLNLFDYGYYGGDNYAYQNYLQKVEELKQSAKSDKKIADGYAKNATLVKNGYVISGRVIIAGSNDGLPNVKISIDKTSISTLSNSLGYFKIKVPVGSSIIFKHKGYRVKQIKTKEGGNLIIDLRYHAHFDINEADPGVKSLTGDKNADVTIDEPVGSADQKVTQFAAPVVKPDAELKEVQVAAAGIKSNKVRLNRKDYNNAEYKNLPADVLKKVQGIDDYGDQANLAGRPIALRTNFNETAFFYPQLHTNEKGEILIDFTIPEALTRWKFRGFAHTQDLQTGYIENTVITQKQLSISANTPRFLREGDTITISARLANLTSGTLKGKVQMQLFNALNMQPVTLFINKGDAAQQFEVAGNTNKAISFRLVIPAGLDALTYRLTADAGQFTDGEENTLPVLPNRTLVTESMPMMVRSGQTRDFTLDKLVNQSSATLTNKTLTLEYTQNPAWYAVQALPYMMEFPYECSEQIFSRYYANCLATSIVTKLPAIKQVFDQWKSANSTELLSNLEKNQELKSTLIEETPWLQDAMSETEQKKRIALLFDLNKMSDELKLNLDKLQKRQLPDGGFTWFGGDRSDRYITQHIAEGMGELYHLGITDNQPGLQQIADNAIKYLDDQLIADEKYRIQNKQATRYYGDLEIHAWFTRSYFLNKPMNSELKTLLAAYLKWAADNWTSRNVYEQGMIALTMQRYKKPEITNQIEKSLLETAQQSDDLGMYWAKNLQGYFWYESPVETQSLLIELFTEAGDNAKTVDEMKIWLLRNKQTSDWKTTKATAAACYALLLKGNDLLADSGSTTIKLDGKPLEELKPDVKADAGTGYIKTSWADEQIKPALGKVEIKNSGKTISWGALHWQYLENLDKITSSQINIHLERKYFIQKQTDAGPVLIAVDDTHLPKTGDLLKVVVYLKADRDFEYVQLKDMRPAGTEPVDALSTYKYQDGLYYYQVTKDVATNFFISYLNKGSYVFEYRLRVAQPGNFSTGITSIQSMYAPEFNAHSQGSRMRIKP